MSSCFAALALFAIFTAGCSVPKKASDLKPSKLFSLEDEDEPEEGIPVRMEGTWTDTVLNQPGQKPQRGFGGRLIFYGRDDHKPILVDGQLVVYAFDETGREPTDNRPTRRYVFPADQLPLRMSKSEIGASYSFWLPWDEAGGPQTEVSLICRFEPKGGAVVVSEQTKHLLPGSIPANGEVARRAAPKLPEGVPSRPAQPTLESIQRSNAANSGVQLAGYESAVEQTPRVTSIEVGSSGGATAERRMTTTSIPLPQGYRLPVGSARVQSAAPANPIQPAVTPQSPIHVPAPAVTNPAQAQVFQSARVGQFPPQQLIKPTVATPTVHLPTSQGFGFAAINNQQAQVPQTSLPQVAPRTYPGMVAWGSLQRGAGQMPQQQAGQVQVPPQATIVQPASQPLPPPTPLTTTVSSPPVPFLQ
ncbi:MAG TPA: hypothetical protein VGK58_21700 [Lacipirellulaceae bacterium]